MTLVPPDAVLSEHIAARMRGRRLVAALFATYQFDGGFFEQEVLPVLLDTPVSHAKPIRLVQLDAALRSVTKGIAVYYDAGGIVTSDYGSPRLDVKRIPVRHQPGVFHAKNIFLLVEEADADEDDNRARALLIASTSANLTRSGWWENVEVCHVQEIDEKAKTRLPDDLLAFLDGLKKKARSESDHSTLSTIRKFLDEAGRREQRTTDDLLHTHFYSGRGGVIDFLKEATRGRLQGCYLEIISPFFDDAPTSKPLEALIEQFAPKAVRVFLPRGADGEALCRKELYDHVRALPDVSWGTIPSEAIPKDFLSLGTAKEARQRFVHAKIYRFFTQNPKREIYLVGSANLTRAAHQADNVESGFLVEVIPERRPDFWLKEDSRKPLAFQTKSETADAAGTPQTPLNLRYHWDTSVTEVFWDAPSSSPELRLEVRGVTIGTVGPLTSRLWLDAGAAMSDALRPLLSEDSLVKVYEADHDPTFLLVQEEGVSHKPSLLLQLSATDILRYWALLTLAQRAAFLEARAPDLALTAEGAELVARAQAVVTTDTFFDRFAGFFHAFGCLERAVREGLEDDNDRDATYRLFGKKHDSLGYLLDRVLAADGVTDEVERYVIILCAQQLCREIGRSFPEFWSTHRSDVRDLEARFEGAQQIRQALVSKDPDGMPGFLDWFDQRFLARARAATETE